MILTKKIALNGLIWRIGMGYSHYDALGLDEGASQQEIRRKYYELAKKYHPDVAKDEATSQKFIKIKQAYETLGDEKKRKQYDNSFSSRSYASQSDHYDYSSSHQRKQYGSAYYSYQEPTKQEFRPPMSSLIKDNIFSILMWIAFAYMFRQIMIFLKGKFDEADRMRQSIMIAENPNVAERRKKLFAQQMKDKNIYGRIINVKFSGQKLQTTKSMQYKKESIESIQGIKKDTPQREVIIIKPQYM